IRQKMYSPPDDMSVYPGHGPTTTIGEEKQFNPFCAVLYNATILSILKHLPNFITLCKLFCGCIGIVVVLEGHVTYAAYLIWLAALLDFLDGFVARLLHAYSPIGKELDSLADMVTFGVLPSIIMFVLLQEKTEGAYWHWIAFVIAACSALRLAKFNVDTRQSDSFIGLPTPANALFISALPFIIMGNSFIAPYIDNAAVLIAITLLFSYLMVAE